MSNEKNEKKDGSLAGAIILLVCSVFIIFAGEDYVWYPFGLIEIPLQIVAVPIAILAGISVFAELKKKKNHKEEN